MKKHITHYALGALAASSVMLSTAHADENLWVYAKGAETRPQGSFEFKLSSISRLDKDSGDYAFHDIRPEIEYGITNRLTIGAELMIFHHDYSGVDESRDPVVGRNTDTNLGGFEINLKYMLLSPYKDPIGLAIGLGFEHRDYYRLDGADIDQDSFVANLYLQKNFLDNTLVVAFTGKVEFERRKSPSENSVNGVLEEEIAFDLALGVSYRFAPKWFIGIEARYQSDFIAVEEDGVLEDANRSSFDFSDFRLGDQFQYGLYVGPSIHYAEEDWWFTAGILWQVKGGGDESRNGSIEGNKVWDEHERVHVGLTVGFEF